VNRNASDLFADQFALTCVQTSSDLDAKRSYTVGDRASTADCACGTVECGEKAIPRVIDLPTTEPHKFTAYYRMVFVEQFAPAAVANMGCLFGGAYYVGEEYSGQNTVWLRPSTSSGEKLLDLIQYGIRVAQVVYVIGSR
jgi:hypothetical protein